MYLKTFSCSLLVSFILIGCGGEGNSTKNDDPLPPPSPVPTVDEYLGAWQQQGYGQYYQITEEQVVRYQASDHTCIITHTIPRSEFPARLHWTVTDITDEAIAYHEYDNARLSYQVDKIGQLPSDCSEPLSNTPVNVVEHLIAMAGKYYAFFEQRGINWQVASDKARASVHDEMNDSELKAVLIELMSVFNDRHVVLHSKPIDLLEPEFKEEDIEFFGTTDDFTHQVTTEFASLDLEVSFEEYHYYQLIGYYTIINNLMDDGLTMKGGLDDNSVMWGTINNTIGYLHINELDYFDPNYANKFSDIYHSAHLTAFNQVLDEAINDLQHMNAIVLDIRMHSGGTSDLDRALAQRFIEQDITYGSFSAPEAKSQLLTLSPYDGVRLSQPTALITSNFVASSGEDMVMALKAENDMVQIGERTLGTFSDMLFLSLPNQWAFSLSNETWLDKNGDSWEGIGIIPEHEFDVFPLIDRQNNKDSAIERALELLQ